MKTLCTRAVWASLAGLFLACSFCFAKEVKKPAEGSGLRVGVVGDQYGVVYGADPYPALEHGIALLKGQNNVVIALHLGDLIEGIGQGPGEYKKRFDHAAEILDRGKIPWYLTPGDHDVNPKSITANSDDRSIEKLFFENYRSRRPELGPKLFYSFDVGAYHFVALNSLEHLRTEVRWGDTLLARMTDEQFDWLQKDLAGHRTAAGIVVFMHQPLWYNVAAWEPVHRLLRQYPVRAVVAGHLHFSEDDGDLDGIRYLVIGATGGMAKQTAPESGGAPVVAILTLTGTALRAELLQVEGASPLDFASRRDMDRIQALDYTLDTLDDWRWERDNAMCVQNGALIMPMKNGAPAVVRLRAIGNPIDIQVTLEIKVEIGTASRQGTFKAGICSNVSGQRCLIAPGTNVDMSNMSTVQFRWPDLTETSWSQEVPPLSSAWAVDVGDMGTGIQPGAELHLRLKYSFQGDGGIKYLERDIPSVVTACSASH